MCRTLSLVYVECPVIGTFKASAKPDAGARWASLHWDRLGKVLGAHHYSCKAVHPVRIIDVPKVITPRDREGLSECDARCLNGKKTCNCKCRGLCHGAGSCQCAAVRRAAEAAALAARPEHV